VGRQKRLEGRNQSPNPPSTLAELILSPIQPQAIPTSHEKIAERNIKNIANMKNILEK
jgi:hypothetical protein